MTTATVVKAWQDGTTAFLAVNVDEGGGKFIEYISNTPLVDPTTGAAKSPARIKTDLTAAVKALRDAQQAAPSAIAGITGSVTI